MLVLDIVLLCKFLRLMFPNSQFVCSRFKFNWYIKIYLAISGYFYFYLLYCLGWRGGVITQLFRTKREEGRSTNK